MALYINNSNVRKLVAINRSNRWLASKEVIDLNSNDVKFLGANSVHIRPYVPEKKKKMKMKRK